MSRSCSDRSDDTRRLRLLLDEASLGRVRFLRGDVTERPPSGRRSPSPARNASSTWRAAGADLQGRPALGAMVNVVRHHQRLRGRSARWPFARRRHASSAAVFGPGRRGGGRNGCLPRRSRTTASSSRRTKATRAYLRRPRRVVGWPAAARVYGVGRDAGLTSDPTRCDQVGGRRASVQDPFQRRDRLHLHRGYSRRVHCLRRRRARRRARIQPPRRRQERVGDAVAIVEDEIGPAARGLISIDGPVIPMPPSLDDTALRLMVAGLPQTRL